MPAYETIGDKPNYGTSEGGSKFVSSSPSKQLFREVMAEILGTFILVLIGEGVVAQVVLSNGVAGGYVNVNLCWGLALLFGIHASGGISGGHLNPAVSVALACFKKFEWAKVPFYIAAQFIGAFFGSLVVYLAYYAAIANFEDSKTLATAGIFATYPQPWEGVVTPFFNELIGTAILLFVIVSVSDEQNMPASPYSKPSAIALALVAIGMAFGYNTPYAVNPARDFAPRLMTCIVGYGFEVFTSSSGYFWVPLVAPFFGGIAGVGLYYVFVEMYQE